MGSFGDLLRDVSGLYSRERYQDALDLIAGFEPEHISQREEILYWSVCFLSRLGKTQGALATFSAALDEGFWWSNSALSDSDLDPLRDESSWSDLVNRCLSAQTSSKIEPDDLEPVVVEASDRSSSTLLVVLHGAGSRPHLEASEWLTVTENGWTLVFPESSQRISSQLSAWHDLDRAISDVKNQLEEASAETADLVVISGFSQGAGLAAHLACGGFVDTNGMVLVALSLGSWDLPQRPDGSAVPCRIMIGDQEHPVRVESTETFARTLTKAGWPVQIDRLKGVGHAYPPDFGDRLNSALNVLTVPR